jgi:O-antigen/teichoic acid export membrane protein
VKASRRPPRFGGRQSLISLSSYCVSLLALTALLPVLVRTLGPEEYGAWVLTGGIATYVLVFDFGLSLTVTRFVALHRTDNTAEAEEAVTIGVLLLGLVGLVIVVVTQVAAPAWAAHLKVPEASVALRAGGIATAFVLQTTVLQAALEGAGRVALSRVLQAASSLVFVGGGIAVTLLSSKRLTALSVFLVAQSALAFIVFAGALVRTWGGVPLRWPRRSEWRTVLAYALTMQGSAIFVAAIDPASRFLVGAVAGTAAVAPVDIALRARAQWFAGGLAFTRPLLPELGAVGAPVPAARRGDEFWRSFAPVAIAAGLLLAVVSFFLVPVLFGPDVGDVAASLSAVASILWIPAVTAIVPYVFLVLYGRASDIFAIQLMNAVVGIVVTCAILPISATWAPILGLGTGSIAATVQTFRATRARTGQAGIFGAMRLLVPRDAGFLMAPVLAGIVFLLPIPLYARGVLAVGVWTALMWRRVARLIRQST